MSDYQYVAGLVGILKTPVTPDAREAAYDALREKGFVLNYEGTLIFEYETKCEIYDIGLRIGNSKTQRKPQQFVAVCEELGYPVYSAVTVRPYSELYYDGGDPGHCTMTMKEFYEKM